MMLKFYFSAALAQVVRNSTGGCQYEFEDWTDCHYTSETTCEQTRKVIKNIAFPPGQKCTSPRYIPNDQGRKSCQCTEPWSQELACGYKFTKWTECARTGAEKCERTRQITERTFLYTTGLRCFEVGQQVSEVCTTCDELDVVKACGYEFEDWTTCAVNPFKADGTCHETRKLKSATRRIAGVPCYSAPAKIPGELGEKVCPCPAAPSAPAAQPAQTTVQQQFPTAQEQATAACETEGKVPSCGATCQANVNYSCVCPAGQVAKGASGPCEAQASGKPTTGDKNPKAWNPFAPSTSKVTTPDANTDVEWKLVDAGDYVQACKYTFKETAWSACGANGQKTRTLSAAVELYAAGYSCHSGTKGYQISINCTPSAPAAQPVTENVEPRECQGNGRFCLAGTMYTTWMKANCKQTCAAYLATPPVVDTWIGNCATFKDKATANGKTYCTDEAYAGWQQLCLKTCQQ